MPESRITCPDWCRWRALHQAQADRVDGQTYVTHQAVIGTFGDASVELSRLDVVDGRGRVDVGDTVVQLNADAVGLSPGQARDLAAGLTGAATQAEQGDR